MPIKTFTDQKDWLKFRKNYVMASELASIMGLNKHQTANQLLLEKGTTQNKQDPLLAIHSRRGKILEDAVASALRLDLGWDVVKNGMDIYYDDVLGLAATPDAFKLNKEGVKEAVVELKTSGNTSFNKFWRKKQPYLNYILQTYAQMLTTELDTGYLACMTTTEVDAQSVRKQIPSYYSSNSVVNISVALFKIKMSEKLTKHITDQVKKFTDHKAATPEKRFSVASSFSDEVTTLIKRQIKFVGLYESIPYNEED